MKKQICLILVLMMLVALAGCSMQRPEAPQPTDTPAPEESAALEPQPTPEAEVQSTQEPVEEPTPEPEAEPTPEPEAEPAAESTPEPAPEASTEPTPTPAPVSGAPIVRKSPTDETVKEGGSCYFVARYEFANTAVWHFVSPDGQRDLTYIEAKKEFPTMQILNGMFSTMQLKDIPATADGWSVYCLYTNRVGSTATESAKLTVTSTGTSSAPGAPIVNKSPTDETVKEGGSCYFVSRYEFANTAVWHFVSPDGQRDLTYIEAAKEFQDMKIINGMYSTMQLKNIPAAANGWTVYCLYTNRVGSTATGSAKITVTGAPAPAATPAPSDEPTPAPEASPEPTAAPTEEPADTGSDSSASQGDNPYASVTNLSRQEVEDFARKVRKAYLDADWETMSTLIQYPITMYPDVEIKTADDFIKFMSDKEVAAVDAKAMEDEKCTDLAFNGAGISMASGLVWFRDVHAGDGGDGLLQVFALAGMTTK